MGLGERRITHTHRYSLYSSPSLVYENTGGGRALIMSEMGCATGIHSYSQLLSYLSPLLPCVMPPHM